MKNKINLWDEKFKKKEEKIKLTNIYEESYTNKTGNIDVDELATAITARMLGGNVRIPKTKVIEVDIQREIAVGKIDTDAVKSEEIKGKVNNKLNKEDIDWTELLTEAASILASLSTVIFIVSQ